MPIVIKSMQHYKQLDWTECTSFGAEAVIDAFGISPSNNASKAKTRMGYGMLGRLRAHVKFWKNRSLLAAKASTYGRVRVSAPSTRSDWKNALPSRMFL